MERSVYPPSGMQDNNYYCINVDLLMRNCFLDDEIREGFILRFKDIIKEEYKPYINGVNVNKILKLQPIDSI